MTAGEVWLKAKGALPALLGLIATVLAFVLYRKWAADHVNTLKDALVVAKAEKTVAVLDAQREAVTARVEARAEEIQAIDQKLADNQAAIVHARTGAKTLTREQVLAEYARLGYPVGRK